MQEDDAAGSFGLAFKRTWTLWFKVAQAGEQARRYSISLGTRVAAA